MARTERKGGAGRELGHINPTELQNLEKTWRQHPLYTGYSVSLCGQICGPRGVRKPVVSRSGYAKIGICSGILKNKKMLWHRVVATCWIPNPENKKEVDHIDGNKLNNAVSNLRWVTPKENSKHTFLLGLKNHIGTNNTRAKISEQDVRFIRSHCNNEDNRCFLAQMYGFKNPDYIAHIIRGIRWGHVV